MTPPLYENGFGILAADGKFWSSKLYHTEKEAEGRLAVKQMMKPDIDLSKHQIVPVTRTMRVKQS